MIDVVFDLEGSVVPEYYPYPLWDALVSTLPLINQQNVGVHPLRGSVSGREFLLAKRSKLILRVAEADVNHLTGLSGSELKIGEHVLRVGMGRERELQAANTLHAWLVQGGGDEIQFMEDMRSQLDAAGVDGKLICDKRRVINDGHQSVEGYGLVLHDLKPQVSMQIQQTGLGGARHLGCGIFVPFKAITGLE